MLPSNPTQLAALAKQLQQGIEQCTSLLEAHNNAAGCDHHGGLGTQPPPQQQQQQHEQQPHDDDDDDVTMADEDDDDCHHADDAHHSGADAHNPHNAMDCNDHQPSTNIPSSLHNNAAHNKHQRAMRAPPVAAPPPESIPVQEMFHLDQLDEAFRQRGYMYVMGGLGNTRR